jgi:hypothetical protein
MQMDPAMISNIIKAAVTAALATQAEALTNHASGSGTAATCKPVRLFKGRKFSGDDKSVPFWDFLVALKNKAAANRICDDGDFGIFLASVLEGTAANWLVWWRENNEDATIKDFVDVFKMCFKDLVGVERVIARFYKMRQGRKETVVDVNKEVSRLLLDMDPQPSDAELKRQYLVILGEGRVGKASKVGWLLLTSYPHLSPNRCFLKTLICLLLRSPYHGPMNLGQKSSPKKRYGTCGKQ